MSWACHNLIDSLAPENFGVNGVDGNLRRGAKVDRDRVQA